LLGQRALEAVKFALTAASGAADEHCGRRSERFVRGGRWERVARNADAIWKLDTADGEHAVDIRDNARGSDWHGDPIGGSNACAEDEQSDEETYESSESNASARGETKARHDGSVAVARHSGRRTRSRHSRQRPWERLAR